jgi:N,N-dimethylglycine/sarcosine catabolism electron transfer flavoprotein subunit alpha
MTETPPRDPKSSGPPRRDPRAERAARQGTATPAPPEPAPAPDVPTRGRRDPRAERAARASGQAAGPAAQAGTASAAPNPVRIVADPAYLVLAVPDLPDGRLAPHDRDVLGGARLLADAGGGAVAVLAFAAGEDFAAAGADRLALAAAEGPEARTAAVLAAVRQLAPRHVVLPDTLPGGGDVGRRVAAALGERPTSGVVHLAAGRLIRRMGGGSLDAAQAPPRVILLALEAAEPPQGPRAEARPIDLAVPAAPPRVADRGRVAVDANAIPLAEADVIVSAGNGVTDWPAFHRVAAALGATEGASRVICDAGLMPRERQVGASGTLVEPRCYLAFGIAGATQHLQGIARCERVVAVNTDLHADMIKRADLAVVADAQAVMPALAALAEAKRGGRHGA